MTRSLEESSEEGGFESWAALREDVDDKDGLLQVQMWELRELIGRGRLGVHVRASITRELAGMGIAHLPPNYRVTSMTRSCSTAWVRLLPL